MYTMMQVCRELDLTYQTLKFYCNEGLVPNVKRDKNNRRVFGERDVKWIRDLSCLKKCGMTIQVSGAVPGGRAVYPSPERNAGKKQAALRESIKELEDSIA